MEEASSDPFDPGVVGDIHDPQECCFAFPPLVLLEGVAGVSQGELGLGEGPRSHQAPFMGGSCMEQGDGRDQDDGQCDGQDAPPDQLAPHMDVVGQGLAAPERGVAEHDGSSRSTLCGQRRSRRRSVAMSRQEAGAGRSPGEGRLGRRGLVAPAIS